MRCRTLCLMMAALFAVSAAAQLATQKSTANGVTVAVTPGKLGADANVWEFAVVLDTHSEELSDDLAKSAVLLDHKGGQFKALGWDGASPGGHHRKGVLKFNPIAPRPHAVELRIHRPGEANARTFRWELK